MLVMACLGLGALAATPVSAQVYKCEAAGGRVEYRSIPCDWGNQRVVQQARGSAVRAEPTRSIAVDDAKRPLDPALVQSCESLQARVNAALRHITTVQAAVKEPPTRSAAPPGASDQAEIDQVLRKDRALIAAAQRQAEFDQCDRVGVVVGSATARSAIEQRDCKALRDELAYWQTGAGQGLADSGLRAQGAADQLQARGCKAG